MPTLSNSNTLTFWRARLLGFANKFLSLVRVGVIRRVWTGSGLTKPVYHKESLTFSDKLKVIFADGSNLRLNEQYRGDNLEKNELKNRVPRLS